MSRLLLVVLLLGAVPPIDDDDPLGELAAAGHGGTLPAPKDPPPVAMPTPKPVTPPAAAPLPPALAAQTSPATPPQERAAVTGAVATLGTALQDRSDRAADRAIATSGAAGPTRPGTNFKVQSEALDQLRFHVNPQSVMGKDSGSVAGAKELARIAFDGGVRRGDVDSVRAYNTPAFTGSPKSIHDSTAVHWGSRDPNFGRGLKIKDVPSPNAPPPPPKTPEKGVRMSFDAAAISLAVETTASLRLLEESLLASDLLRSLEATAGDLSAELLKSGASVPSRDLRIVSLADLAGKAAGHAARWTALPADLRHPGELRRIHGLLIDRAKGDVSLVGSAEGKGPAIDIDDIIVALQSVWRDGASPMCSLDPDPRDLYGPQRTVVGGVPRSSHFAKAMIDADYAMKRVTFGAVPSPVPGFQSWKDLFSHKQGRVTARNWFLPVPVAFGEIRKTPDGSIFVFNARMELRTENLELREGTLVGTGDSEASLARTAASFTAALPQFEAAEPLFHTLHALFDLTLAATLLRLDGVDVPALRAMSALPLRTHDLPASYPGVVVPLEVQGIRVGMIGGGVTIDPKVRGDRIMTQPGSAFEGLKRGEVQLYEGPPTEEGKQNSELLRFERQTRAGKAAEAAERLTVLLKSAPKNAEAWLALTEARARQGLHHLAARCLSEAEVQGLDGARAEGLRLRLLDARGLLAPESVTAGERATLVQGYLEAGDADRALHWDPSSGRAYLVRAGMHERAGRRDDAARDLAEAVAKAGGEVSILLEAARMSLERGDRLKALTMAEQAVKAAPKEPQALVLRAMSRDALAITDSLKDIGAALALDPANSAALVCRAELLLRDGDIDGARGDCTRVLARFPHNFNALLLRAALRTENDPGGAVDDLRGALLVRPEDPRALFLRGSTLLAMAARPQKLQSMLEGDQVQGRILALMSSDPEGMKKLPFNPEDAAAVERWMTAQGAEGILQFLRLLTLRAARIDLATALRVGLDPERAKAAEAQLESLNRVLSEH